MRLCNIDIAERTTTTEGTWILYDDDDDIFLI